MSKKINKPDLVHIELVEYSFELNLGMPPLARGTLLKLSEHYFKINFVFASFCRRFSFVIIVSSATLNISHKSTSDTSQHQTQVNIRHKNPGFIAM